MLSHGTRESGKFNSNTTFVTVKIFLFFALFLVVCHFPVMLAMSGFHATPSIEAITTHSLGGLVSLVSRQLEVACSFLNILRNTF